MRITSVGELAKLPALDYPALTEDLEQPKADIDEYGIALVANALLPEEVSVLDERLKEQAAGEAALGVGTLMRGDEGFGARPTQEQRVRLQAPRAHCDKARRDLGLETHSIEDTLLETGRTMIELGLVEPKRK